MVSSSSAICCAIVIVASFFIGSSFAVSNKTLTKICSKTQNPKKCVTNLQTVPCTTSADLPKLSLISIELAGKQADQNLETFRELSHNATAAKMKEEFDACVRFYKEVRPQIQAAHLLSQKRQYENNSALLQANEFALRCSLGISIDSLEINQLQESVLLKLDTSISVNRYIALAQLKGCSLK